MGSLMAGWNSPNINRNLERTRSFTKEEIEAFRKSQNLEKGVAKCQLETFAASKLDDFEGGSDSAKPQTTSPRILLPGTEYPIEVGKASSPLDAWWTKSKWAFLNEPPVEEDKKNKSAHNYKAQFHNNQLQAH